MKKAEATAADPSSLTSRPLSLVQAVSETNANELAPARDKDPFSGQQGHPNGTIVEASSSLRRVSFDVRRASDGEIEQRVAVASESRQVDAFSQARTHVDGAILDVEEHFVLANVQMPSGNLEALRLPKTLFASTRIGLPFRLSVVDRDGLRTFEVEARTPAPPRQDELAELDSLIQELD